eukprot:TRINITY_DN13277_c0_g1_i1.p1 TRINITY_DN13277_c0_g1~~TRINITY_DN13277_c0_g1_i1.p1  ORF type:complete len:254 (-),score=44.18 TRINITY_DN13277_c0_g1_i1:42-803(-)
MSSHKKPIIHAVIPARGGSKGVPRKNIKQFHDHPLIYWTIQQGIQSKYIDHVYVTTDDIEIQQVAIESGAKAPFLRPEEISGDQSIDLEWMRHYIDWANENLEVSERPDVIVHLRCTSPSREVALIDDCIEKFLAVYDDFDSLRTVSLLVDKTPFKMYMLSENGDGNLQPLFREVRGIREPYNQCRQFLPDVYVHNGMVDVVKVESVVKYDSMTGENIYAYIYEGETDDIDTPEDFQNSSELFSKIKGEQSDQ